MDNNMIIKRNPKLIAREINEDFLVFDPQEEKLHNLNKSAALIYKYLWKARKIEEIANMVIRNYSVSRLKVQRDIISFIENGLRSGLIIKLIDSKS